MHVIDLVSTCHPCGFCNAKTFFFFFGFVFRPVKSRKRHTSSIRKKHYSPLPRRRYSKWSSQYKKKSGHHRFFFQWPIWKEKSNLTEDFAWYTGLMTISKSFMVKFEFSCQMSHWKRDLWRLDFVLYCDDHFEILYGEIWLLVSNEPLEKRPVMTIEDFIWHSDDHFEPRLRGNGLYVPCEILDGHHRSLFQWLIWKETSNFTIKERKGFTFHVTLTDETSCYSASEINYSLNGVRA